MPANERAGGNRPPRNALRSRTTVPDTRFLSDLLAALVRLREALDDGDTDLAREIIEGPELDLGAYLDGAGR
jgi:hypothetical protein